MITKIIKVNICYTIFYIFQVCRIFHVMVSSLLPVAVFQFTKVLYRSRDVSIVSAILCASSLHLNVFGTHTLTESFLSPIIFLCLTRFLKLVSISRNQSKGTDILDNESTPTDNSTDQSTCTDSSSDQSKSTDSSSDQSKCCTDILRDQSKFVHTSKDQKKCTETSTGESHFGCSSKEITGDSGYGSDTHFELTNGTSSSPQPSSIQTLPPTYHKKDLNHNLTMQYDSISNGRNPMTQNHNFYDNSVRVQNGKNGFHINAYMVQPGPDKASENSERSPNFKKSPGETNSKQIIAWRNLPTNFNDLFKSYAYGCMLGICVYIRVDSCILICFLVTPYIIMCRSNVNVKSLVWYVTGATSGIVVGICDDLVSYRTIVLTPWQWVKFNIIKGYSSIFFGRQSFTFYISKVFAVDVSLSVLFLTTIVLTLLLMLCRIKHLDPVLRTNTCLMMTLGLYFTVHSLNGHKETRFLHNVIVLVLIFCSSLYKLFRELCTLSVTKCDNFTRLVFISVLIAFISSQFKNFPHTPDAISKWTYGEDNDSVNVNVCLDFIGRRPDARGVFLQTPIGMTGAYTVLNINVPLFAMFEKEFYILDNKSQTIVPSSVGMFLGRQRINLSLHTVGASSEYISVQNPHYILKVLINHPEYNYLVMSVEQSFLQTGYAEVFRYGSMRVLKRTFEVEQEKYLAELSTKLQLVKDVSILNHEAYWLWRFEQYDKAIERLRYSLTLNENNIQAYNLLMYILVKHGGNEQTVSKLYKQCKRHHSNSECNTSPRRVALQR